MQVQFKNFRDSKNKLFLTYWNMNKGEVFTTCDLSFLPVENDNQIEDYGCTFVTSGSFTYQETESDIITNVYAGDSFNRRPSKSVIIRALEDNSNWCYSLHFDSIFTTNENEGIDWESSKNPKVINGEQIKISKNESITLFDFDKDIYILNPIYNSVANTISYKSSRENIFSSLDFGKYLKIDKGETFIVQSTVDTYIPKIYYIDSMNILTNGN
jgi:hypothetical protein